jgi:hypothetical protein
MRRRPSVRSPLRLVPYTGPATVAVHGSLALALDSGPPVRTRPPLGVVREGPPDLRAEARVIAQLVLDVLTGARPYHHLAGRTTPALFERLGSLSGRAAGRTAPRLGTVRVCSPVPGVMEVTAIATVGSRVQALALRLEHDRRWRCAAIETTVPG